MTTFALKLFALVCMIIDHVASYLPDMPVQMRWIGRIAAPVYVFCLCEGIDHTSNEKKYLLRLYIGSIIMALIQYNTTISANIFRTLFIIAINLVMIKNIRKGRMEYKRYYLLFILYQIITITIFAWMYMREQSLLIRRLLPALAGSAAFCEGGIPYVIFGILVYLLKNNKVKLTIGVIIFCAMYALLSLSNITTAISNAIISLSSDPDHTYRIIQYGMFASFNAFRPGVTGKDPFTGQYQWMMVMSIIPILLYNGQKGRSMKWFFYVFYVVHIVILWYISQ